MFPRMDIIFFTVFMVHVSAQSTLTKTSLTMPDNCVWSSLGSVQCKHVLPEFSSYDPLKLAKFGSVTITDCNPVALGKKSFAGFDNLLILHLDCKLSSVELGAFDGLSKLQLLSLHGQEGTVLPDGLFCGLPSLAVVLLNHGSLAANTSLGFHSQCIEDKFSCGINITILSLIDNALSEISNELLCNLPNLHVFNASNNQISMIAPMAFSRMQHLLRLSLSNNSLTYLNPFLFRYTPNLALLDLSFNKLAAIPTDLFKKLTVLNVLNLKGNKLEMISNAFVDLISLTELDLSYNSLYVLGTGLNSLKKLDKLNLSGNKLMEIASATFLGLNHLSYLNLDNNLLTSIDEMVLKYIPTLAVLSIKNNKLIALPNFTYTKLLISLSVSNNSITTLDPTAFESCFHVFMLDFSSNKIESINNQTFANMTFLLKLDLSNNSMKSIENGSFAQLENLKILNLQNNHLTFQENIYGDDGNMDLLIPLVKMQLLNMSSNRISSFAYSWFPSHLIYLSLSNNLISSLPIYNEYVDPIPHLHILDLSNNQIHTIIAFHFPPSLTHIILNMNKIENVASNAFQDLMSLETLSLHGNSLQGMPPLSVKSSFTSVSLRDNPWLCDCKLNWIKDTKNLRFTIIDYLSTKCRVFMNKTQSEVALLYLNVDQFLCTFTQDLIISTSCISSSDKKSCLYHCPPKCTCYHDITWKIVKIDCSSASLKKVPEYVPEITSSYYLDGNSISSIDSTALQNAKSLQDLYLNASKIITIEDGAFEFALELEVLHLDNNLLETLPNSVFLNLTKLTYLDLSVNQLKNLSKTIFTPLTALQTLNLQSNKLTNFPVWAFTDNPSVTALSLYNNPWSCECNFALKYREWLQTHLDKLRNITRLQCLLDAPTGIQSVSLVLFNATHCNPTQVAIQTDTPIDNTGMIVAVVCVSIVALVAGVLAFVIIRARKLRAARKYGERLA